MFHPSSTEPTDPADEAAAYTASQQAERVEHCMHSPHQLIDLGMDVARVVHHQAQHHAMIAVAGGTPAPDMTPAFERAARTVLMAQHIAKPQPERPTPAMRRTAARSRIIRAVEDAIQQHAGSNEQAAAKHVELRDRLDSRESG